MRQSSAVAKNAKNTPFYSNIERKLSRLRGAKANSQFGKFSFAKNYSKIEGKAARGAADKNTGLRGVYLGNAEVLLQQALTDRQLTRQARKLRSLGRKHSRHYAVKARPF